MQVGDRVKIMLGSGHAEAVVVAIHEDTMRVKLKDGSIIKRHKDKHVVGKV